MNTIKKQLVLMVAILMVSVLTQAQDKIHWGAKAGLNFAVQSDIADYGDNSEIRTGLQAGLFGNYAFNEKMQLQTELNYEQKGGKSDEFTSKYDYLTVPVLFKYSLGKSDQTALKFNVNAGPYASYLLNAEVETDGNTIDMMDLSEDFEMGAILGFGMKYPVKDHHIVLDLRMGLGFTSFDKADTDLNNKYIGLSLGYEF